MRKTFKEKASGEQRDRSKLAAAVEYVREGYTLVMWKLARSMKQLIETVEELVGRGIGFRSITEAIDPTTAGSKLVFRISAASIEF